MNEINLLRPKKDRLGGLKNVLKIVRILSAIFLFLTFCSSVVLFFLKLNSPLSSLKKEEDSILLRLSPLKSRMAQFLIVEERLKNISEIISKRPYWDKTIGMLEKEKPQDVSINMLSINKKNLTLTASSYSLRPLDKLLNNLIKMTKNKVFTNLILNSTSLDKKSERYTLSIVAGLP